MMNLVKPSLLFLLISLIPFLELTAKSFPTQVTDSILYNWAISGLNIRSADHINAEKISAIPYGEPVTLLDEPHGRGYLLTIEDVFSNEDSGDKSGMYVDGRWVKIRYNAVEGYVFNGFLSSLPPMKLINESSNNISSPESFQRYLERNFGSNYTGKEYAGSFYEFGKKEGYSNGAIYEKHGKEGWFEEVLILPDVTLNEGKLLILFIYDSVETEVLDNDAKPGIMKQDSTHFSVGLEGESYELYQFGSTLVIVLTRSC